ncbi:unnamed protein product [Auanema sp. JU1783]|nr:unnamed protein product [Auanema sp. JU1783]
MSSSASHTAHIAISSHNAKFTFFKSRYRSISNKNITDRQLMIFQSNLKPSWTHSINGALEWVELDSRPDCNEIQDYLGELTGARSVPRVFVNGISLGGCDDTASYAKSGRLHSLLLECQGTYM